MLVLLGRALSPLLSALSAAPSALLKEDGGALLSEAGDLILI